MNKITHTTKNNGNTIDGEIKLKNETETLSLLYYKIKNGNIMLALLYTYRKHRNNGYATQLVKELIKEYGEKYDITLECCPFEVRMDKVYKIMQEEVAKFYEQFGFETTIKEDYPQEYQWEMTRIKK